MLRSWPRLSVRDSKLQERPPKKLPELLQSRPPTWSNRGSRWSVSRPRLLSRPGLSRFISRSLEEKQREKKPKEWLICSWLCVSHRGNSLNSRTNYSSQPPRPVNLRINRPSSQLSLARWTDFRLKQILILTHLLTRTIPSAQPSRFLVNPHQQTSSLRRPRSATTTCSALVAHSVVSRPRSTSSSPPSARPCQISLVGYSSQRSNGRWRRLWTRKLDAPLQSSLMLILSRVGSSPRKTSRSPCHSQIMVQRYRHLCRRSHKSNENSSGNSSPQSCHNLTLHGECAVCVVSEHLILCSSRALPYGKPQVSCRPIIQKTKSWIKDSERQSESSIIM